MITPWACFTFTLRQCCVNMACAPLFLAAIAVYAAYYCWPYMAQLPDHIHCAIVDADGSALSRRLSMEFQATPKLKVLQVTRNRQEAIDAMKRGELSAIVEIPANFEASIRQAIPSAITMTANGAYLVGAKMTTSGVSGPLDVLASKTIAGWLGEQGAPYSQLALMDRQAPALLVIPVYNTISGYLNFAVPIVFIAVFQTLMTAAMGMLFNSWWMTSPRPPALAAALASPLRMLCAQMPVFFFCLFWAMFIEGPVFYLQGANSFQNIPATLLICLAFSGAVSSFACFFALLLGPTHFVMQAIVMSALPCVFISGNLWPLQNIPPFFQALGWIFPSTPGSAGIMRASQCGASINEIGAYLFHLLLLAIIYFLLARLVAGFQRRRYPLRTEPMAKMASAAAENQRK